MSRRRCAVLARGGHLVGHVAFKLAEPVRGDFFDWSDAEDALRGYDVCFFTLGVSADA